MRDFFVLPKLIFRPFFFRAVVVASIMLAFFILLFL